LNCGKDVSNEVIPLPPSDADSVSLFLESFKAEKTQKISKPKNEKVETYVQDYGKGNDNLIPSESVDIKEELPVCQKEIKDSTYLLFLEEEERKKVLSMANTLAISDKKLHPQVLKYKDAIDLWNKK